MIGCDEVGRGAIAGPVAVGVCVVDAFVGAHPTGLRDSKMLSEKRREELAPSRPVGRGIPPLGLATALEVDAARHHGGAWAGRASARSPSSTSSAHPSPRACCSSTASYDWLTPALQSPLRVRTRIKADRDCASVAAASVVAKVHRDRMMIGYDGDYPGYGWAGNKGYGSAEHFAAIDTLGPSALHRLTWLHDRTLVAE